METKEFKKYFTFGVIRQNNNNNISDSIKMWKIPKFDIIFYVWLSSLK